LTRYCRADTVRATYRFLRPASDFIDESSISAERQGMTRELFWFGVVGVTAMLVHLGSVSLLLVPMGLPPLLANVLGFLLAFQVSHAGHHKLTFGAAGAPVARSRVRFFMVALISFVINELMYALLLHFTQLDYRLALAMVLVAVAALTFFSARNWAFAAQDQA
jgi:putative flippase GtrA